MEAGSPLFIRDAGEFAKCLIDVVGGIFGRSGIAGRINPRSASEGIYLEARVVGEATDAEFVIYKTCLLDGIFFDSITCLRNVVVETEVGRYHKFKGWAQDLLGL